MAKDRKSFFMLMNSVRARRMDQENAAAMMFAIIVLLISTVIAITVSMFTLTSIAATKSLGLYVNYNAAVQDAISNAYLGANGPNGVAFLEAHRTNSPTEIACDSSAAQSTAAKGFVPSSNMSLPAAWQWNAYRTSTIGGLNVYNIIAYGFNAAGKCSDATARSVLVTLSPVNAASGCYTSDGQSCMSVSGSASASQTIIYQNSDTALFNYGLLGTNSITLGSDSSNYPKVYSYSSGSVTTPTAANNAGDSTVATNGVLKPYSHSTGVYLFLKLQGSTCANQTGGDADACASISSQQQGYKADLSALNQNSYLKNCTTGSAWVASAGTPLSNYGCYSSIDFDQDTIIPAAVKVYTYGAITVEPGVHVNYGGIPSNLQIFSSSSSCVLKNSATTATSTEFSGLIAGSGLNCQDNTNTGRLNFYGALAASTLSFTNANTALYVDDTAKAITQCTTSTACRQLWSISTYQSRN